MAFGKKLRSWLAETHGPQFELVRHFLSDQLANDLTSSDQVRRLVITLLAALTCVGPLIVRLYMPKYNYLQGLETGDLYIAAVRADRLFFITISMLTAGLFTVIQCHGLFPSRRDYLVLKPLPIRLYQVLIARFLSASLMLVIVLVALNLAASFLFPFLASGRWQSPSFGIRYIVAHWTATFCAGLFTFLALNALQGVLMIILPPRIFERLSVLIQALFAAALLAAVPYVLEMPDWHEIFAAKPHWMLLFPPAWFLGVYECLLGAKDIFFLILCRKAVAGIAGALFFSLAAYCLCYRHHARRVLEQSLTKLSGQKLSRKQLFGQELAQRLASALLRRFVRTVPEQGTFVFAIQTLRRSRHHKLITGFSLAIAFVWALQTAGPAAVLHFHSARAWRPWELESVLAVPLVIALNWSVTLAHIALIGVLALLLIEVRLYDWHKIPFTCSYVPGRRNFWQTLGTYLLLFAILIPTITYFEARLLHPFNLLAAAAALSVGYFFLRSARRARWKLVPLLFDESDDPLLNTMRLNRE